MAIVLEPADEALDLVSVLVELPVDLAHPGSSSVGSQRRLQAPR